MTSRLAGFMYVEVEFVGHICRGYVLYIFNLYTPVHLSIDMYVLDASSTYYT